MLLSYEFYKDVYGGTKLTEDTFPKYIAKGVSIISKYTMDRVNETTIDTFPDSLSTNIKKCACELAEFKSDCDKINDMVLNSNTVSSSDNALNKINSSNIKSITAGAVSYTMDTSTSNSISNNVSKNYTDQKSINKKIKSILDDYLYPQHIGDKYYNLMSFVSGCNNVRYLHNTL